MDAETYMLTHSTILLTALAIVFFLLGLFFASLVYAARTRKMKEYRDRLADCETSSALLKRRYEELRQQLTPAGDTPESTFTASPAAPNPVEPPAAPQSAAAIAKPLLQPDSKSQPAATDENTPGFLYPDPPEDPDDLTRIKGIGVILQGSLNKLGVYKYSQIALWTDDLVSRFSEQLTFKDRIQRENWRAQAKALIEKNQSTS